MSSVPISPVTDLALRRDLRFRVEEFHCAYSSVLDRGDIEQWPEFFTDDAVYRVISRDNHESDLPLGLMLCEGIGMLRDRAFAIAHTEMYAPRYVQHQVTMTHIVGRRGDDVVAEANYLVYETQIDEPTKLLQAGKYRDVFADLGDRLLLRSRQCVFDTVVVHNCVVYPV